jgi:hypothetical protein
MTRYTRIFRRTAYLCALVAVGILGLCARQTLHAQQMQAQVVVQPLQSPYLNDYERMPGAIIITVVNTSQQEARFKVSGSLKLLRQNRVVVATRDQLTREFVAPAGGSITLQAPEFLDRSTLSIAREDEANVLRTGRIPEGEYELCVKITDPQNPNRLLTPPIPCRRFRTQTPQPPRLLSPANASSPTQAYPVFSWTASLFVSGRTAQYVLTVAKILQGQTPRQALESNIPLVRTEPLPSSSFTYPPTAEQFDQITDAIGYVWQVQAVDENNVPIGENDGKSEIFTFFPPAVKQGGSGLISGGAQTQTSDGQASATPRGDFPTSEISGVARLAVGATQLSGEKIQVSLLAASAQNRVVAASETDAQTGAFVLRNVALGEDSYSIMLRARGGAAEKIYPIGKIAVGERKENINLSLEMPSYEARIAIADEAGKPVAGAVVAVSRASGSFAVGGEPALNARATSDANGVVTLKGLLVAQSVQDFYVLTVKANGYKTSKTYLRQTSTGLASEQIRLERAGARVTGFVRQANETVANAAVYLASGENIIAQSISDNDGSFTLEAPASVVWGLSSTERQNLRAYAAYGGKLRSEAARVQAGDENAELTLQLPEKTVAFSGVVQTTTAGGGRLSTTPLSGAIVRDLRGGASATTDAAGRFTLESSGETLAVAVSRSGFEDAELTLKPSATNEITLKTQGAWIQLVVSDARTDKPIARASVVLIDSAGATQTDAKGVANLRDFPQYARSLTVFAAGYAAETLDFLPSNGRTAERLEVRLRAGGSATGTVKDASGKPLANASVTLAGYENTLEVKTGADGKYRLDYLPAGEARLIARASGFLSSASDVVIEVGKARSANFSLKKLPAPIQTLAGFEARIDDAQEDGDAYRISGVLTNLKPSKLFASLVSTARFQDVRVSKTSANAGNALPVDGKFSLLERELPMKFADEFPVKAKAGADGLTVILENPEATQGVLKAAVQWQFADYVNDVAAGASANVEEVQILFSPPLLGKDGAERALYEEHSVLSASPETAVATLQSEENEYKAACEKVPTITVGGVTLAMKCDNFTIDVAGKNASFGALATLPENPLGLDTLTINPIKMGKTWGFQSADIQFAPSLSIPLASTNWSMDITRLAISNTGVKIAGTLMVGVAASLPLKGVSFSDLGVAVGGVSGGSFSTSPAQFDLYGITTITVPQLSVAIAGDSITVRVSNGKISLTDAEWSNLNIPAFQFTRRLDNLRKIPNLPAFKTPSINMPANNLRRPSFPGLGKLAASLKGIVSVELTSIEVNDQSQLAIDGSVAFQFPGLQVQAGNFLFGKNTFVVREFGFALEAGKLYAGMAMRYETTPRARFSGEAKVEINKTGATAFLSLEALIMYESRTVWSVDFKAGIPPVQLVPPVPIYLAGFGGGLAQDNADFRVSLNVTLQNAPAKPAPMEATLGVSVRTSGVIEGTADLLMVGEKFGNGRITLDIPQKSVNGSITLGLTKGGVTATGTTNYGVNWGTGDYFVNATTQLQVPTLFTANGYFYYGVETKTVSRTIQETKITVPTISPNTPPAIAEQVKQMAQLIQDLDNNSDAQKVTYNVRYSVSIPNVGTMTGTAPYTWSVKDNLDGMRFGQYTMKVAQEVTDKFTSALPNETEVSAARATTTQAYESKTEQFRVLAQSISQNGIRINLPTIRVPLGIHWAYAYFENNRQPTPDDVQSIYLRGQPAYNTLIQRIAFAFAQAGIKPSDLKVETVSRTENVSYQDGKCLMDVSASLTDLKRSIDFGIGNASFYSWANGRFKLETSKDFKTGSGSIATAGGTGFSLKVIGIRMSADASIAANLSLKYSQSSLNFDGSADADLRATVSFRECCARCSASCNSIDGDFICGEARACVGVRANFSYSNGRFSSSFNRR